MEALWEILAGARNPSGLLMVKVREMQEARPCRTAGARSRVGRVSAFAHASVCVCEGCFSSSVLASTRSRQVRPASLSLASEARYRSSPTSRRLPHLRSLQRCTLCGALCGAHRGPAPGYSAQAPATIAPCTCSHPIAPATAPREPSWHRRLPRGARFLGPLPAPPRQRARPDTRRSSHATDPPRFVASQALRRPASRRHARPTAGQPAPQRAATAQPWAAGISHLAAQRFCTTPTEPGTSAQSYRPTIRHPSALRRGRTWRRLSHTAPSATSTHMAPGTSGATQRSSLNPVVGPSHSRLPPRRTCPQANTGLRSTRPAPPGPSVSAAFSLTAICTAAAAAAASAAIRASAVPADASWVPMEG